MQNPYYEMTVPVFSRMLQNLDQLLEKGLAHATAAGMSKADMLAQKLAPDMFPLLRQVQIATDNAKGCVARLAGIEAPVMEDTETTVADLQARIEKTLAFMKSVPAESFATASERKIEIKYFPGKFFTAQDYLTEHAIPNFFFHVTTAYSILRMMGVGIGKADYMGNLSLQDLEA